MASLYPRTYLSRKTGKRTTYWFVSYYRDGIRRAKSAGTSKSVALELKKHIEAELRLGKFDFLNQPGDHQIEDPMNAYLGHVLTLRKPKTFVRYRDARTHVLRFLRERFPAVQVVRKLKNMHFTEYQSWRKLTPIRPKGKLPIEKRKYPAFQTINNELSVCRSWLNWAVNADQIQENPLQGLKKLKRTDSRPRRTLTIEEINRLMAASKAIELGKSSRRGQTQVWRFLLSTGLRIGELTNLQWKDIDFRRHVIKIQRKPN